MPPPNILNAPTKLMKDIGYGKGYTYDHDAEEGFSGDNYWPEEMEPQTFYEPVERGFERQVQRAHRLLEQAARGAARMSGDPLRRWDEVEAFALTLPGTERGTSYRMPTVKVAANGRGFVWTGREAETSFATWTEPGDDRACSIETDPDTFWQSPHYVGSNAVLVRYGSDDPERVRYVIGQAYELATAMKPARKRKTD